MGLIGQIIAFFTSPGTEGAPLTQVPPRCPGCSRDLTPLYPDMKDAFRCAQCQGLWLAPPLFADLLILPGDDISPLLETPPGTLHTFSRSRERRECPGCGTRMDNTQFDYNSGIWIDSCPESHGIWLDAGELHLVREHRRNLQGELTAGEKAKISAALLDGRSTTMRNRLDILGEIAASRREHGGEY